MCFHHLLIETNSSMHLLEEDRIPVSSFPSQFHHETVRFHESVLVLVVMDTETMSPRNEPLIVEKGYRASMSRYITIIARWGCCEYEKETD